MIYHGFVIGTETRILGQVDTIPATARVSGFDRTGAPVFSGGSDVIWDEQAGDDRHGLTWWVGEDDAHYPASLIELRAVDDQGEIVEDIAPVAFPVPPTRLRAEHALRLLREARDILKDIGATRAVDRVREAISSTDGAVRAASVRDTRAAAPVQPQVAG
ncbi:MAG: hypothetical protein DI556_13275 [Rhodovulum sulfidophilum]|uniref:Uncharacterized protein n=1 Tax=Rhodovulum sulfidophilum TaxID=35806 RepID=A0A2W5N5L5_RHOSU|nr:MAG: hypothetical protein DI556_13275 [Rhodovulum sulfidophilum]